MLDPLPNPQDDTTRSGARRIASDPHIASELPATPPQLVNRPRIITGQYSIVRPERASQR